MNVMLLALALSSSCFYAAESQAMIVLSNGQTQVVWHVGDPDPDRGTSHGSAQPCVVLSSRGSTSASRVFRCAR
jgi:hypothetical protein